MAQPPKINIIESEFDDSNFDHNTIRVMDLKKYFNNVKAVDGISFEIKPGEIYGLLGPNGAGKTTTIKNILGILEPDSGEIRVKDLNPEEKLMAVKQTVGYVSEEPMLYKSLTPRELFDFIISIRGLDPNKSEKILNDLFESLEAIQYYDQPIITLSKGNKQKVQIIASLVHEPELLIMDEPLAGLDARSSRLIKDILKIHKSKGGSVLLCTHVMEIAEDLCDRIGIINHGKLIAEGTIEELKRVAQKAGAVSLEDIFLRLTEQDTRISAIITKLKETLK